MSIGKKLVVGSSLRVITLLAHIIVALLMLPYMLGSLGERLYGMWVIIGSIISFYGMLDLGLSTATQRYFAYELHKGSSETLNKVISTSFFLFISIGAIALVITVIGWFSASYFIDGTSEVTLFRNAFTVIGVGVSISFPFYVFNGVLTANLRYDYSSYIQLFKLMLRTVLFVYLLENNATLVELAIATVIADMAGYWLLYSFAKKLAPELEISYSSFDAKRMKSYFNYGAYAVLSTLSDNVRNTVDTFILGAYIGLSSVAHYNVAYQIAIYVYKALNSVFGLVTPLFTTYYSRGEMELAKERLNFVTKLAVVVSILAGGIIVTIGAAFIKVWVGDGFEDVYYPLVILTTCSVVVGMQIPNVSMLYAMAKHKMFAILNVVEVVLNVILSLLLVDEYGMIGVALGSLMPMIIIRLILQPVYVLKQMNMKVIPYYLSISRVLFFSILVQLPIYLYLTELYTSANIYEMLAVIAVCYPVATLALIILTLNAGEKIMLYGVLKR